MTDDGSTPTVREDWQTLQASIIETMADGVFVLDPDGTVVFLNEAIESFVGIGKDDLVGKSIQRVADADAFDEGAIERLVTAIEAIREDGESDHRVTIETTDARVMELRLCANRDGDILTEIVATVRDVTRRERALQMVERQQQAIYRLYQADVDMDLTVDEKIKRALTIGCEFLDLPIGFLTSVEGDTQRYDRVVGYDDLEGTTGPMELSYCRFTVASDDPVAIRDAENELGPDDPSYVQTGASCYIGTKIPVDGELYGTFCFAAPDVRDRSFSDGEREFVRLLGLWAGHKIERQQFETLLRGLHDVGQELLLADSQIEVARIGVDAAEDLFDLPIAACLKHDEAADSLQPLAETETARRVVGETTVIERGDAPIWESFDSGEIRTIEETPPWTGAADLEAVIHVPLGRQGVLVAEWTQSRSLAGIEAIRLLGNLLRDGLIDVEQQELLAERGEALQQQNDRLEEFANVVAHDLRNPLAGAIGFLEIARETNEKRHFDRIETSLERMRALIEKLLDIARDSRQAVEPRDLALSRVVEEAWSYVDAPEATLSVSDELGQLYADETRLLQLFGNLFRNSVEHAGDDVTVEVGRLDSVEGFYVEDDGPGLPEGAREDVLALGRTSSATGTGIGLDSVTDIIDAHGWTLSIPEAESGARFEIWTEETKEADA